MTKSKNIEYKNGMKFKCGPPIKAGGYDKWNWCKPCESIWEKPTLRCGSCNQMTRASAKNKFGTDAKNHITKAMRQKARIEVQADLIAWQKDQCPTEYSAVARDAYWNMFEDTFLRPRKKINPTESFK